MKRKLLALILTCILLLPSCAGQPAVPRPEPAETTPEARISRYIGDLAGKDMEGRRAGTRGEYRAALYIARIFQKAGLQPMGDQGTYFQAFTIGHFEPVLVEGRMTFRSGPGKKVTGENILGLLPGKEEGCIVISAHYDHLGIINNRLYPGANDNASGTAVILELVSQLKEEKPRCSILFALWSAEEEGLLGSDYFCRHPTVPLDNIRAIINLDSVGYLNEERMLLGWTLSENETSRDLIKLLGDEGWQINWEKTEQHSSDHASFGKRGVAGFTLLSAAWLKDNHTPLDLPKKINTKYLTELTEAIKRALL